jgi:hypothetical protein
MLGANVADEHPVRDPVGDRAGLPGAGTSEDAHRPGRCGDRCALLGVEAGEHPPDRVGPVP